MISDDFQWALINPDTASASGSWTISLQIHGRTIMRFEIFQHKMALKDEGVTKTPDTNVFIWTDCLLEKLIFNHRSFNWICEPVLLRNALSQDTSCHCHPSVFWVLLKKITSWEKLDNIMLTVDSPYWWDVWLNTSMNCLLRSTKACAHQLCLAKDAVVTYHHPVQAYCNPMTYNILIPQ